MPRTSTKPDLDHLDGCSAERIETYTASTPSGDEVQVIRCVSCGAQDLRRDTPSDASDEE